MAVKLTIPNGGKTWHLYVNATSVGTNGNNSVRTDIQLVQFFLKKFYEREPYLRQMSGLTGVKIDGKSGPKTAKGILWFQKAHAGLGNSIAADGLVDVITSTGLTPNHHTVYTIIHLNSYFREKGQGRETFDKLENHPDIITYAPELHAELSKYGWIE